MALEIHESGPFNGLRATLAHSRLLHFGLGRSEPRQWATDSATVLLRTLRGDLENENLNSLRTIVVATFPAIGDPDSAAQRAATVQSLRGIIQSVTREFAHAAQPINLVAADESAVHEITNTLRYLDSDNGSYTAGSTIDLTTDEGTFS